MLQPPSTNWVIGVADEEPTDAGVKLVDSPDGGKQPLPLYNVNINGYPGDKPFGTMWHAFCGLQIVQTLMGSELSGELVLSTRESGGTDAVLRVPLQPAG